MAMGPRIGRPSLVSEPSILHAPPPSKSSEFADSLASAADQSRSMANRSGDELASSLKTADLADSHASSMAAPSSTSEAAAARRASRDRLLAFFDPTYAAEFNIPISFPTDEDIKMMAQDVAMNLFGPPRYNPPASPLLRSEQIHRQELQISAPEIANHLTSSPSFPPHYSFHAIPQLPAAAIANREEATAADVEVVAVEQESEVGETSVGAQMEEGDVEDSAAITFEDEELDAAAVEDDEIITAIKKQEEDAEEVKMMLPTRHSSTTSFFLDPFLNCCGEQRVKKKGTLLLLAFLQNFQQCPAGVCKNAHKEFELGNVLEVLTREEDRDELLLSLPRPPPEPPPELHSRP